MGKPKINNPQVQELLEKIGKKFPQEIQYEFDGEMHIIKLNTETVNSKVFKTFICDSAIQEKVSQKAQSIIFISNADRGNYFTTKAITIPYKPKEKSRLETAVEAFEAFIKTKSATNTSFSK
jgi:hypothetical protein